MHLGAKPSLFRNAAHLRKNPTEAEEILWKHLRDRQMERVKFRRQHPTKRQVPDLYAHELKLGIEVDGGYHMDPVQQFCDRDREEILAESGIILIRFSNEEVIYFTIDVLSAIRAKIISLKSLKKK